MLDHLASCHQPIRMPISLMRMAKVTGSEHVLYKLLAGSVRRNSDPSPGRHQFKTARVLVESVLRNFDFCRRELVDSGGVLPYLALAFADASGNVRCSSMGMDRRSSGCRVCIFGLASRSQIGSNSSYCQRGRRANDLLADSRSIWLNRIRATSTQSRSHRRNCSSYSGRRSHTKVLSFERANCR